MGSLTLRNFKSSAIVIIFGLIVLIAINNLYAWEVSPRAIYAQIGPVGKVGKGKLNLFLKRLAFTC